jgi:hypothetical protein
MIYYYHILNNDNDNNNNNIAIKFNDEELYYSSFNILIMFNIFTSSFHFI